LLPDTETEEGSHGLAEQGGGVDLTQQHDESRGMFGLRQNVGGQERIASGAAGAILALLGLSRGSLPGLLVAGIGAGLLYRGVTGNCPLYEALDLDTAHEPVDEQDIAERGNHVGQAFLINRSPEELYQFWRNFENLPRIMTHLKSVRVTGDRRSHWVAEAPRIAGGQVEWDAEITADEPNRIIAWRSLPGSDVDTVGEIRFEKAMGDRGTLVNVSMEYIPPAGQLGHWLATLFGDNPNHTIREDLRNFKRIMEVGEILTVAGQPRGTCTGEGKRQAE
jgi:uncharacterized membrane protein